MNADPLRGVETDPLNTEELSTMKLQFTITPAHTQIILDERLEGLLRRSDRRQAKVSDDLIRLQYRVCRPLPIMLLSLATATLTLYFYAPTRPFSTYENVILGLSVGVFLLLWWFSLDHLTRCLRAHLAANRAKRHMPRYRLRKGLIEIERRRVLNAAGVYRLRFDDHGFTSISPQGVKGGLAWKEITCLTQTSNFYSVTSARLGRQDKTYYIPRHSDVMDCEQYQSGLELFLSRIPTPALIR